MTNLLKQAFAAASALTANQQDELAEILLSLVGADTDDEPAAPPAKDEDEGANITRH